MLTPHEHGENAYYHEKHIQANPFDTGTPEHREWNRGYLNAGAMELVIQYPGGWTAYDYNSKR